MKVSLTGWAGKSCFDDLVDEMKSPYNEIDKLVSIVLFKTRGVKDVWWNDDWPPVKVKITVEVLNEKFDKGL